MIKFETKNDKVIQNVRLMTKYGTFNGQKVC
jgi:hypothetical protein